MKARSPLDNPKVYAIIATIKAHATHTQNAESTSLGNNNLTK